jgi:hypothetical protein
MTLRRAKSSENILYIVVFHILQSVCAIQLEMQNGRKIHTGGILFVETPNAINLSLKNDENLESKITKITFLTAKHAKTYIK